MVTKYISCIVSAIQLALVSDVVNMTPYIETTLRQLTLAW